MKKWVLYLFTFNRPHLVIHAINSIEKFLPFCDYVLVDDGSFCEGSKELLDDIRSKENWRVKIMDREEGLYGGFYKNMNWALNDAKNKEYDFCYFFEDDEQCLWLPKDYKNHIENIFDKCKDAHFIDTTFFTRLNDISLLDKQYIYCIPVKAYKTNRGFNTTGIWNMNIVRKEDEKIFYQYKFGSNLPYNSAIWLGKGYRMYCSGYPTVALIPWVESKVDSKISSGSYSDKKGLISFNSKFKLKTLSDDQIDYINLYQGKKPIYQEYFDILGKNTSIPDWHQKILLWRYFEKCAAIVDSKYFNKKPKISLSKDVNVTIAPNKSHLRFKFKYDNGALFPTKKSSIIKEFLKNNFKKPYSFYCYFRSFIKISPISIFKFFLLCRKLKEEKNNLPFSLNQKNSKDIQ